VHTAAAVRRHTRPYSAGNGATVPARGGWKPGWATATHLPPHCSELNNRVGVPPTSGRKRSPRHTHMDLGRPWATGDRPHWRQQTAAGMDRKGGVAMRRITGGMGDRHPRQRAGAGQSSSEVDASVEPASDADVSSSPDSAPLTERRGIEVNRFQERGFVQTGGNTSQLQNSSTSGCHQLKPFCIFLPKVWNFRIDSCERARGASSAAHTASLTPTPATTTTTTARIRPHECKSFSHASASASLHPPAGPPRRRHHRRC
jgi:hypothetical protein